LAVPLETLTPDPDNARAHDERNIQVIMESLSKYGQQTPLVVRGGVILKGNATYQAAKRLGWPEIAAIPFDRQAELVRGYKLVDNRSAELATWAIDVLKDELQKLTAEGQDIGKLGWTDAELAALEDAVPEKLESDATLLNSLGFIAGDPKTKIERGQTTQLGKHLLICADPIKEVPSWLKFLKEGDLFCPFPGPYILQTHAANKARLILVQPDPFIAGYIVDRFNETDGRNLEP